MAKNSIVVDSLHLNIIAINNDIIIVVCKFILFTKKKLLTDKIWNLVKILDSLTII
jgi:hypothetical protein